MGFGIYFTTRKGGYEKRESRGSRGNVRLSHKKRKQLPKAKAEEPISRPLETKAKEKHAIKLHISIPRSQPNVRGRVG